MAGEAVQGFAGGNIAPSRFVKLSTTADNNFLQAGSGDRPIGVSQMSTRYAPWAALDDGYAAKANEGIAVYTEGMVCVVEAGGTIAAADLLKPDSNGKAVTASSDGDFVGAEAVMAATTGQLVKVRVRVFQRGS